MAGIRDKIIHHYFGISYDIIWNTVEKDIPELQQWMEQIVRKETPS